MKDGGEAFPVHTLMHDKKTGEFLGISCSGGMTLRDYFAGQALAGLQIDEIEDDDVIAESRYRHENKEYSYLYGADLVKRIARNAYRIADAMLAERTERKNG